MAGLPVANRIIQMIDDDPQVVLFQTPDRRGHATITVGTRADTYDLADHAFALHVAERLISLGKAATTSVINSVVIGCEVLAAKGPRQTVYTRVAALDRRVVIDLADATGQVVVCSPVGWFVGDSSPVAFRRPAGMLALPAPHRGAEALDEFRELCGEITDAGFVLIIGWLVIMLRGLAPYPLLFLEGGAGSGKTTLAKMLRGLIDPNKIAVRPFLDSQRDLAIMADNSAVMIFDNVSEISREISDCLCRFTSGGGYSTRRLYKGREEELFEISRPALITATDNVITTHDLFDRTLPVHVAPLIQRQTEAQIWAAYGELRRAVLADLLDGVCAALTPAEPPTNTVGLPRLLDAALTADAALAYLGFGEQAFTKAFHDAHADHLHGGLR